MIFIVMKWIIGLVDGGGVLRRQTLPFVKGRGWIELGESQWTRKNGIERKEATKETTSDTGRNSPAVSN